MSPLKVITHPVTGKMFKMGRTRPTQVRRKLHVAKYIKAAQLPKRPTKTNYAAQAQGCLGQVLCNDRLGDCTSAGAFHILGLMLGNTGTPVMFSDDQVETFYSLSTGYVRGNPATDQGGDEVTVLNTWRDKGLINGRHKIAGHLTVDGADIEQVKTVLWLFENLYFGVELPDGWINPMPTANGFTFGVVGDPDPQNGHCYVGIDYDDSDVGGGVRIDTWGMQGLMTADAIAKYTSSASNGELHVVVSQDSINKASQKAPSGFNWQELVFDLQTLGGSVVSPT